MGKKRTETPEEWNRRYIDGDIPWDSGRPDVTLREVISSHDISPCRALEFGCGTGSNILWLAQHGFEITGIDVSPIAIDMAQKRCKGQNATLAVLDILTDEIPGAPFDFIFDRGCLHSFEKPDIKKQCAERVYGLLSDGGLWCSMIGSADGPEREVGPPRVSALEIVEAVEEYFEILRLETTVFDSKLEDHPRAWVCLMRRREDDGGKSSKEQQ
jgi:SAM-dependent methyltransferase